jgi:hypothetical protein
LDWDAFWAFKGLLLGISMFVDVGVELNSWWTDECTFVRCCGAVSEAEKIMTAVAVVFPG